MPKPALIGAFSSRHFIRTLNIQFPSQFVNWKCGLCGTLWTQHTHRNPRSPNEATAGLNKAHPTAHINPQSPTCLIFLPAACQNAPSPLRGWPQSAWISPVWAPVLCCSSSSFHNDGFSKNTIIPTTKKKDTETCRREQKSEVSSSFWTPGSLRVSKGHLQAAASLLLMHRS